MPSPIGHALAAAAAGWLIAGPGPPPLRTEAGSAPGGGPARRAAAFAVVGVIADIDLLLGAHSTYTHSVGAAIVVLALAFGLLLRSNGRWLAGPPMLLAVALAAAYLVHPVLDWLGQDDSAPFGVMLLWPFSNGYFHSGLDWFLAIQRRYWLPGFWRAIVVSVAWELLLLGPLALLVWTLRRRLSFLRLSTVD